MAVKSNAYFEPVRIILAAAIDTTFVPVGDPFEHPIRYIGINNETDDTVIFSFDGVNSHVVVLEGTVRGIDICANRSETSSDLSIKQNTQMYAKSVNPTVGAVYIDVMYID